MHAESKQSGVKDTNSFSKRFNQSILKLTLIYVIILAGILFVSSSVLYSVFSAKLENRFRRPTEQTGEVIEQVLPSGDIFIRPGFPTPQDVREDLINLLILVNGFLLIIAGALSYKLAEWTLSPLKKSYEHERRFLSDASHELRTPLSILKTELENELGEHKTRTTKTQHIESNLEEVDRMSKIISDLLILSRLSENEFDESIMTTSINLSTLIAKTNERLAPVAKRNNISLVCELPKEDVYITANESLIEAVLLNGIKNAITYNVSDGTVTTALTGKTITITDTGIGMSKNDTEKIFDRFYRVDKSRSRSTGGSGLGLSIVKSAIDKIGGQIAVESEIGKGTTLTISL